MDALPFFFIHQGSTDSGTDEGTETSPTVMCWIKGRTLLDEGQGSNLEQVILEIGALRCCVSYARRTLGFLKFQPISFSAQSVLFFPRATSIFRGVKRTTHLVSSPDIVHSLDDVSTV